MDLMNNTEQKVGEVLQTDMKVASMEKYIEHFDVETHGDIKEKKQQNDDVEEIGEIFSERTNESNNLLEEAHEPQPI